MDANKSSVANLTTLITEVREFLIPERNTSIGIMRTREREANFKGKGCIKTNLNPKKTCARNTVRDRIHVCNLANRGTNGADISLVHIRHRETMQLNPEGSQR